MKRSLKLHARRHRNNQRITCGRAIQDGEWTASGRRLLSLYRRRIHIETLQTGITAVEDR
jgi:hypothetical protein